MNIKPVFFFVLISLVTPSSTLYKTPVPKRISVQFKNMLGVNAFEWDFLQDPNTPGTGLSIFEPKFELLKSFSGVRHYLDWGKIEPVKGSFTFNPTSDGGWNLDVIYQRCKSEGIDVLVCLKTCPNWLLNSYPANSRDPENVPIPYGSDKLKPGSYVEQAKAGFQFAARYGFNKNIDTRQLAISNRPRWKTDRSNKAVAGLGLVKYIECDNERDKSWKGDKGHQSPEEYAANLSAFYDGDQGRLGKNAGVKTADPTLQVVMAGLSSPNISYVQKMITWCKKNRGYKKDGTIDVCFDVINFHLYANNHKKSSVFQQNAGIAPELSNAGEISDKFVELGNKYHLPIWVTEAGYDINSKSPQSAVGIENKSATIVQADWIIRTAFLYARHQIQKLFFYELYDDHPESNFQYASSGLVGNNLIRRPAANYIKQVKDLIGKYHYEKSISTNPLVDVYSDSLNIIYVLMMPSQTGKQANFNMVTQSSQAEIYTLNPRITRITKKTISITNKSLTLLVTETPIFVKILK